MNLKGIFKDPLKLLSYALWAERQYRLEQTKREKDNREWAKCCDTLLQQLRKTQDEVNRLKLNSKPQESPKAVA